MNKKCIFMKWYNREYNKEAGWDVKGSSLIEKIGKKTKEENNKEDLKNESLS